MNEQTGHEQESPHGGPPAPSLRDRPSAGRTPTLRLRDYEPADRTAVIQLLSQGRPPSYRRMKEAIFDWQFRTNPDDDGRAPFLVGTVGGEIAAINGFMPARIRYQGRPLDASWSCDTYVASMFRGHGFGRELIRAASRRSPVMLGYGISDMSDPIFGSQGWALHPAARLVIFHLHEPGLKGTLKELCSQAMKRVRSFQHPVPRLDVCRHDEDFGAGVDELWSRSAPSYFSAVKRDASYLNWKYRRHPFETYSWYAARTAGRLRGLVVARHASESSVIVDYCGPGDDVELMSGLVAAATSDLAERGTMRVQCETTHAPLLAALERSGYIGSQYPPRFRVRTNCPGDVQALRGWFLMSGDSDGDMITRSDAARAFRWPVAVTPLRAPMSS